MKIVRTEDAPHASPEGRVHFTSPVGMTRLLEIEGKALVRVVHVAFEPGARTYWHAHPAGQILHVVKGTGLIQTWEDLDSRQKAQVIRPGEIVRYKPNMRAGILP